MKQDPNNRQQIPPISRRDFIRYSAWALAASALPGVTGCASVHPKQTCLRQFEYGIGRSYHKVFRPANIGKIRTHNRILRSATSRGLAKVDGRPSQKLVDTYVELCEGDVGAIITGVAIVDPRGALAEPNLLRFHRDYYISANRAMTQRIHRYNTPIILQIGHAGRQTRRIATGDVPMAPSAIADTYYNEDIPHALTEAEIYTIIQKFIEAIERAQKAEFDGVQLQAAHGYLLAGFLSPATNKRNDQWGGSVDNRFRIIREIYEGARKKVGDYPIWIKINAYDYQTDGLRVEETLKIAKRLQDVGCDAIEVSSGMLCDGLSTVRVHKIPAEAILAYSFRYKDTPQPVKMILPALAPLLMKRYDPVTNYNVCAAHEIKQAVEIPVIVVGGIRNLPDIEQIIGGNMADFVSLARPFITEPGIVKKFKARRQMTSQCISCGYCLFALEQMPVECLHGELT